jgi:hypothetical protein
MPNWCENNVEITSANSEHIAALKTLILNEQDCLDFEKIVPIGKWTHEKAHEHWGVKWTVNKPEQYSEIDCSTNRIFLDFHTPWKPPVGIVVAIRGFISELGLDIKVYWRYHEPSHNLSGCL